MSLLLGTLRDALRLPEWLLLKRILIICTCFWKWMIVADCLLLDLHTGISILCIILACMSFQKLLLLLLLYDLLFLLLKLEHMTTLGLWASSIIHHFMGLIWILIHTTTHLWCNLLSCCKTNIGLKIFQSNLSSRIQIDLYNLFCTSPRNATRNLDRFGVI